MSFLSVYSINKSNILNTKKRSCLFRFIRSESRMVGGFQIDQILLIEFVFLQFEYRQWPDEKFIFQLRNMNVVQHMLQHE